MTQNSRFVREFISASPLITRRSSQIHTTHPRSAAFEIHTLPVERTQRQSALPRALSTDTKGFVLRRIIQQMQFFARLESNRLAGRYAHLGAGPRISSYARLPRLHGKHAKTTQLNPVAGYQRLLHAVEDGVHRILRLGPRKSSPLNDPLNKV